MNNPEARGYDAGMNHIFNLKVRDFVKGLAIAVASAVLSTVYALLQAPDFSFASLDWNRIGTIALTTGISYLMTNFLSSGSPESGNERIAGIPLPK